jgi:hypothetical protein
MMRRFTRHPFCLLALCLSAIVAATVRGDESDGFVELFNGRNLDGWLSGPDRSWVVDDCAIALRRDFDGQEHNLDYLWTEQQYGDFLLELEFRVAQDTNSGVYLRTPDRQDPVYTGIEVQVANSFGRDRPSRTGTTGAIYDCVAPTVNAIKPPGQWNQYVIRCQGARIEVSLNGQEVVEMDLDRWTTARQNPDGTQNKFGTPLKDFARRGHVGLQDHGRPVWYRNIRIKSLDP